MKIYYEDKQKKLKLYNMWREIFGDTKEFSDYYFNEVYNQNKVLILENNKKILSMIHLNPYNLSINNNILKSYYIVGVATQKEHRKKGYMSSLIIKSLNDLYNEEIPFVFLMPAKESIYTPFDFRFFYQIYLKNEENELKIASKQCNIEEVLYDNANKNELVDFSNKNLSQNNNIFVFRDILYFDRIYKEVLSEDGNIFLIYKNKKLIGYYIVVFENQKVYIREFVTLKENKYEVIDFISNKYNGYSLEFWFNYDCEDVIKKPILMGRIVNLNKMLSIFRAKRKCRFIMNIIDDIIEENNAVFEWIVDKNSSVLKKTDKESEFSIKIGELFINLIGYKKSNIFKDIECLDKIFLHEIV